MDGAATIVCRVILNALLWFFQRDIPWRLLPKSFPPRQTVSTGGRQWARRTLGVVQNTIRV